jgi:hypothetical protein
MVQGIGSSRGGMNQFHDPSPYIHNTSYRFSLYFFVESHWNIVRANSMSIIFLTLSLAHVFLGKLGIVLRGFCA